jgi:DNA-binding GntR family transcriptional regulator
MNSSGPITRRTAKEEVTLRLRERIAAGDLEPGQKMNLREISEELGVSMTPVREAFEQLSAEGLLRSDAFKGARVAPLSAEEYQEIFLMRSAMEGLVHRLGSEHITADQCDELEDCLISMAKAATEGDVVSFVRHDRRFHEIIYTASGREMLKQRLMSLRVSAERYTRAVLKLPRGGMEDTVASHRLILEACRRHDGAAAEKLMVDDLRVSYESFADTFAEVGPNGESHEGSRPQD